jgi:serine/threonine-protein kinase RsbW
MRTRVIRAGEATVDVKFCLMFPRETLSVPVTRRVLGDTLGRLGVDDDSIGDLLLAVTEACTNVLQHGGPGHRYEVVASVGPGGCLVEVLDSGGPGSEPGRLAAPRAPARSPAWQHRHARFRRGPLAVTASRSGSSAAALAAPWAPSAARGRFARARRVRGDQAIARLPESGRGLAIMRACVDDVTLSSDPGRGTVVSLRKRIEWRGDGPLAGPPATRLRDAG